MSRLIVLVTLAACGREGFVPGATCDDAHQVSASGLLLQFTFDDNVIADSSPAAHPTTCSHCPVQVAGLIGAGAASFDGSACITIADAVELRPSAFTAAMWMNPSLSAGITSQMFTHPLDEQSTINDTFEMYYNGINGDVYGNAANVGGSAPFTPGWHHFALVFDGTSTSTYLDGSVVVSPIAGGAAVYSDDALYIGCDVNDGVQQNFYVGALDDLRLYDHVLTDAELATLATL